MVWSIHQKVPRQMIQPNAESFIDALKKWLVALAAQATDGAERTS